MKSGFIFLLLCVCAFGYCQVAHPNAHAHNDYVHPRPLFDALENGFTSVEADVHLIDGKLIVSHDHPTSDAESLEDLYLRPLDSIAKEHRGWIYSGYPHAITLMIDIKTEATETFSALQLVLARYRHMISPAKGTPAVQVVISGNRDKQLIRKDPMHLATIDGRPEDLRLGFTTDEMPIISDNYTKVVGRNTSGTPSDTDLQKIKDLAAQVHKENKKLRLWAIPDNAATWKLLLASGVDFINSDKLEELNAFLKKEKQ